MSDEWDTRFDGRDPGAEPLAAATPEPRTKGAGIPGSDRHQPTIAEQRQATRFASGLRWLQVARAVLRHELPADATPDDLYPDDEGRLL